MIWLIGDKGMLGQEVKQSLKNHSIQFYGTDLEVDISDKEKITDYILDKDIDTIINCAAYTDVDGAEKEREKAFLINADAVKNLAEISKEFDICFIHISTDYVFKGDKKTPYLEDDKTDPDSVYGRSKLKGEEYIQKICTKYYIIRTAGLYGKQGKNFVHTMLRLFKEKEKINVVNDQYGSPTYAPDMANAIIAIVKKDMKSYGVYHFSNEGITSWYKFSKVIQDMAFQKGLIKNKIDIVPVSSEEYPTPTKRPDYSSLCKEKIKKIFKIKIRTWQEALQDYITLLSQEYEVKI